MDNIVGRPILAMKAGGHSTWEESVELARAAGVKRLVITHHDPSADDATLDEKNSHIKAAWPQAQLARAGEVLTL